MTVPIDLPRFNLMGGGKREKEQGKERETRQELQYWAQIGAWARWIFSSTKLPEADKSTFRGLIRAAEHVDEDCDETVSDSLWTGAILLP
jgi:hypothetical protein